MDAASPSERAEVDPLLAPWTGPHGGVPPFAGVTPDRLRAAMTAALAEREAEVDAIAASEAPATFDNTIGALDRSGRTLGRVQAVYGVYSATMSTPELREVDKELAPRIAAAIDAQYQNEALFERVKAVRDGAGFSSLTPEEQRLTRETYRAFARRGATLDAAGKQRLAAIHQELAGLYTTFRDNLLHDEETWILLEDEADLAGLPPDVVAAARASAQERGLETGWAIVNTRSSVDPFLTSSTRRDLREKVWRAFVNRGDNGGEHDNNALITRILALRAEKAELLGFPTYAHWKLEDSVAGTPDAAIALMESVWPAAIARVAQEVADQQKLADADGITIQPWDYRFYQEKVRKQRYDLDQDEVKAYLQLEKLREGMFWMAGELYGLRFAPVPTTHDSPDGVPVAHPDIRVWEVTDQAGEHVGLWYFDPYARPGKRSGAWMNAYRTQERVDGRAITPIVSNNSNFIKGAPGEPVLISWDDAETLFHEFGHAIHGLLSDVTWRGLAGTSVPADYVEFPSQLHEHWLPTPEVLQRFARHHETGEPIPAELVQRIEAASTFNEGFATTEYLASALIDMKLHLAGDTPIDPDAFEKETLAALGMPDELVMRHRTPQFAHVFSGDHYAAGYYSYMWADAFTADAVEAFEEAGSMWDSDTVKRLRENVLAVGNTVEPTEGWKAFRGREVDTTALMRAKGFPVVRAAGDP
jgi:peptidyl-dipeptidase Dcp